MTERQKQVLDQVHDLLCENFDGAIYVVNVVDDTDGEKHAPVGGYIGGIPLGMGLCRFYSKYLERQAFSSDCEREAD